MFRCLPALTASAPGGTFSRIVAPVRIGKGAYVAAGSSIVNDVPAGSLGIARGVQVNKEGWVAKKKAGKK